MELYLHSPKIPSWRGAQLKKKHRDNFTLFYLLKVKLSLCFLTKHHVMKTYRGVEVSAKHS
jgi:hypothetical protein